MAFVAAPARNSSPSSPAIDSYNTVFWCAALAATDLGVPVCEQQEGAGILGGEEAFEERVHATDKDEELEDIGVGEGAGEDVGEAGGGGAVGVVIWGGWCVVGMEVGVRR